MGHYAAVRTLITTGLILYYILFINGLRRSARIVESKYYIITVCRGQWVDGDPREWSKEHTY